MWSWLLPGWMDCKFFTAKKSVSISAHYEDMKRDTKCGNLGGYGSPKVPGSIAI